MTSLNIFAERFTDLPPGVAEVARTLKRRERREQERREDERREQERREYERRNGAPPPDDDDDRAIKIPRWVLSVLLSALSGAGVFIWQASHQVTLQQAHAADVDRRLERIEKIIEVYDDLRIQRTKEISALQAIENANQIALQSIITRVDRLLQNRNEGRR